jgi:tRNA(Ile)-lysidine synthase TilS/MesJ
MTLIRPLYKIHEDDIIAWSRANNLSFIQCACRVTEKIFENEEGAHSSKRQEVKEIIRKLKRENPNIEKSIFNSLHAVCIETFPGFKANGKPHSFLERFDEESSET